MTAVSMFEAKTNLSKYVASVEEKRESSIIIMRNGKPVAKLVAYEPETDQRIGLGVGLIPPLKSLEDFNAIEVENDFLANGALL